MIGLSEFDLLTRSDMLYEVLDKKYQFGKVQLFDTYARLTLYIVFPFVR